MSADVVLPVFRYISALTPALCVCHLISFSQTCCLAAARIDTPACWPITACQLIGISSNIAANTRL